MGKATKNHTIDVIFVLAIACAFAASILMVLMMGINVYGNIQKTAESEFNERVCLSYISAKVHSNDTANGIRTGHFEDIPALFVDQEFHLEMYNTIIYVYDGQLMELFCEKDRMEELGFYPASGTPVLKAAAITFEKVGQNLLLVEYTGVDGKTGRMFINIRSEGGDVI
jgi:hypothetical protein